MCIYFDIDIKIKREMNVSINCPLLFRTTESLHPIHDDAVEVARELAVAFLALERVNGREKTKASKSWMMI